jgi:hypothetical protein
LAATSTFNAGLFPFPSPFTLADITNPRVLSVGKSIENRPPSFRLIDEYETGIPSKESINLSNLYVMLPSVGSVHAHNFPHAAHLLLFLGCKISQDPGFAEVMLLVSRVGTKGSVMSAIAAGEPDLSCTITEQSCFSA